ncbi:MAG TPA: adenosylcobinamide-GDP ribazoletransferase [Solirubrobacteraceae bacterium]|nr:adenosylcobinamide-GDP ribazoletransferase [Solirubrobacteraceae bacterium]
MTFLTRLPVGGMVNLDAADVERAGTWFPIVGAALGGVCGEVARRAESPELAILAGTLLTGALHLDALADCADARGVPTRQRALEVMRDPRVGSFGVSAVVCDLMLKRAALARLADGQRSLRVGLATGALARAVPVLLAAALPDVRAGAGTASALTRTGRGRAAGAAVLATGIAAAALGRRGLGLAAWAMIGTGAGALGLRRWLGGVTGDALGAMLELTETGLLTWAVRP